MTTDDAYLNLMLWQAMGSSAEYLLWCSVLGVMFQSIILGITLSQTRRYLQLHALSDPVLAVLGVVAGVSALIVILGLSASQTHQILKSSSSSYTSIASTDNSTNLILLCFIGVLAASGEGYGVWKVWKMAGARRGWVCGGLGVGVLATLGLSWTTVTLGAAMPQPTISDLSAFTTRMDRQGNLYKAWAGMFAAVNFAVWGALIVCLTKCRVEFRTEERLRTMLLWMVSESMLPPAIVSAVLLIQLSTHTPSLSNFSRPLLQCLPALFLLSILHPLTERHRLQNIIDHRTLEGAIKLSNSNFHSALGTGLGMGSGRRTSRSTGSSLGGFKTFSYKGVKERDDVKEGSVRITIDRFVAVDDAVSPPPSAYNFASRMPPSSTYVSPAQSAASGAPSATASAGQVPASHIIAPFDTWTLPALPSTVATSSPDDDAFSMRTAVTASFKSAVPSGKSLARTRTRTDSETGKSPYSHKYSYSRSSRKNRRNGGAGPVLDPTGWPEMPERNEPKEGEA
ncbi:hypothetical protein IAT38_003239 [Cryptococcus sp. DSM 104549]